MSKVLLRASEPADQHAACALILAGLEKHWGRLDRTHNRDLEDIAASYAAATFIVAVEDGRIVGTGALVLRGDGVAQILRMSVASDRRRAGLGSAILRALATAQATGVRRLILETTSREVRRAPHLTSTEATMLKTTIVGSLPKPAWLAEPKRLFAPWRVPDDRLAEAQDDAVRLA